MNKLYEENDIRNIANSIRQKKGLGEDYKFKLSEMADEIDGISGGGGIYQEKAAFPGAEEQIIVPDEGYDALSQVSVAGDENLVPDNIVSGVSIFGVSGTYSGGDGYDLTKIGKKVSIKSMSEFSPGDTWEGEMAENWVEQLAVTTYGGIGASVSQDLKITSKITTFTGGAYLYVGYLDEVSRTYIFENKNRYTFYTPEGGTLYSANCVSKEGDICVFLLEVTKVGDDGSTKIDFMRKIVVAEIDNENKTNKFYDFDVLLSGTRIGTTTNYLFAYKDIILATNSTATTTAETRVFKYDKGNHTLNYKRAYSSAVCTYISRWYQESVMLDEYTIIQPFQTGWDYYSGYWRYKFTDDDLIAVDIFPSPKFASTGSGATLYTISKNYCLCQNPSVSTSYPRVYIHHYNCNDNTVGDRVSNTEFELDSYTNPMHDGVFMEDNNNYVIVPTTKGRRLLKIDGSEPNGYTQISDMQVTYLMPILPRTTGFINTSGTVYAIPSENAEYVARRFNNTVIVRDHVYGIIPKITHIGEKTTAQLIINATMAHTLLTVTFDVDGGTQVPMQTIVYGGYATKPTDPTKEDMFFGGWYIGDTEYNFSKVVTDNLILKAKWLTFEEAFTEMTYIQSSGTQYLRTDYIPTYNTSMEVDFCYPNNSTQTYWKYLCGTRSGDIRFLQLALRSGNLIIPDIDGTVIYSTTWNSNDHKILLNEYGTHKIYFDGVDVATISNLDTPITTKLTFMSAAYSTTSTSYLGAVKLYHAKIYENGELVREYIPAKRNYNNEYGLKELFTKTFLTNAGTGSLTGA